MVNMTEKTGLSRRRFLRTGLAAAGAAALTAGSRARAVGANGRLGIGIIGCGKMAGNHLGALLAMGEADNVAVRAVCDVYRARAVGFQERVSDAGGEALVTGDHRAVLAMDDVDYVVIATPEHSHHGITMDALRAGKHVYCEKPLCHDIKEGQEVLAKVRETGLKLQVGVQGMSDDSYSSAYEAIVAGKLGPVVAAQIDYVRNHSAERGPWRTGVDSGMARPEGLDWRRWVKPLRKRPWNPHHYFEWRCYRDYSGGIATDLFVHRITRLLKACGLTYPLRAVGMGGITMWDDGRDLPDHFEMLLEYPAVAKVTPGMTVHLLGSMANKNRNRHLIRGHEGTLTFTRTGWEIVAEKGGEIVETHKKTGGEDLSLHHRNLHGAIRDGVALHCPVELGLHGLVAARMGNLSWFQQKMVAWDAEKGRVVTV